MATNSIDKAKSELSSRPLVAIDTILNAFTEMKQAHTLIQVSDPLSIFSQAIFKHEGIDEELWNDEPFAGLFDRNLSQHVRHFICICLLRLLSTYSDCFNLSDFGVKAFTLFDEVLSEDVYMLYKIDKKDQRYQKQSKLMDAVPSIEQELSNIISSLNDLEMVAKSRYRERFMATIMNKKSKIFIWPFLPESLTEVQLNQIFGIVEEYLSESKTNPTKVFETFERANDSLESYLTEAEQFGTIYSRDYLGGVIKKLKELLQKRFEADPISKPARLIAIKWEKKYPFFAVGSKFNIGFTITNLGPGHAIDVSLKAEAIDLSLEKPETYLGPLDPTSIDVEIPAEVNQTSETALASVILNWTNFDKTKGKEEFIFELEGQRSDIDWRSLAKEDPYDLEPVTTEDELVGRTETLNQLVAQVEAKNVGSTYIFGQKRVGKTSIVKTLKTRLTSEGFQNLLVIYLEAGDYVQIEATRTIESLGKRICKEIREANDSFSNLEIPVFDGALSPLSDFLDSVLRILPDYRIILILDEFDELPHEMYRKGPIGNAFFLTLRSISGKPSFGFILVGGEKMEYILSYQGIALNKFTPLRVDYFDREKHWSDFQDLVRKPTAQWLEFSDAALASLYEQTSGNPYFTKLICRSLFKLMVNRSDCHITPKEVEEATGHTLRIVAGNSFQHFWEDGIFDTGSRVEERSVERRKVLVALAESFGYHIKAHKKNILEQANKYRLSESDIEAELKDFLRRQVLIKREDVYECNVPFFGAWLKEKGIREIITTFADPDSALKRKLEEEEAYVRSEEIVSLLKVKDMRYRGKALTEERVRAWLSQFRNNSERRLMFRILQKLKFYDSDLIRAKMKEAYGMISRGLVLRMEEGQRRRRDILVSYLDNPGKSGAQYARLFAEENTIYHEYVVERGRLVRTLERRKDLQALVFIDDFIGTGTSASRYFRQLAKECGRTLQNSTIQKVFFIALCGFEEGRSNIEDTLSELGLSVNVRICDPLYESAKCFSDASQNFPDPKERERARDLAFNYGLNLVNDMPLGFGECQATIVFEDSCPNNTLPIFWAEANDWIPLFKR